ncbi:MAG: hypothetical protein MJ214_04055 [Bacilli bacterium]|nr:hypothetical protein [Bacilli bacterium]
MILVLLFFIVIVVYLSYRKTTTASNNYDYLDKRVTQSICGFFVVIIFLSHFSVNVLNPTPLDDCLTYICHNVIGQLMVAPFLFYAGFGVTCQYQNPNGGGDI